MKIYKKSTNINSVSYDEALDIALCFGWIDGQKKKYDEQSWLQKFTPRRKRSLWSKRNCEKVEKLIQANKMQPSGLKEIEAAQADGRWEKAYDSPKNMEIPNDFLEKVKKDKETFAFFQTLNKSNPYAIAWRLQTAKKPETRQRRMAKILEMLQKEEKIL